jgi:lipopolysaccharide export system permease protein
MKRKQRHPSTEKTPRVREKRVFLKRLDRYIITKFLGTYFFCMAMIMGIVVVFDFNEKLDKFMNHDASAHAVLIDYYLNFIPYFGVKFSPLFIFISVIYFTSKMASDTEIIAILASGVSFRRMVRPYMLSAAFLALCTFTLNSFWIPVANKTRLAFEDQYIKKQTSDYTRQIQMEVEPGVILYIDRFERNSKMGYDVFLEKYDKKTLVSRLTAGTIREDSTYHWHLTDYLIRDFNGLSEKVVRGASLDTVLRVQPDEFFIVKGWSEQLTTPELKAYLDRQAERGVANIKEYTVEYYRRFSFPFSAFILTLIGVALSSRKVRGGMGLHLGLGMMISFTYILFDTVSGSFAQGGAISPVLAVWLPNILFALVGAFLYQRAPK